MTKLSRSKIELFTACPRCFWLDLAHGVKRPSGPPFTINNAVDYLLKQEFDVYRAQGRPHPVMVENGIDALPYQTEHLDRWRHNFTGIQHRHSPTDFLVTGAVDDVWVNPAGELIVVDYKATGANQHRIYDEYRRQMEIYQWLLRQNGYDVSPRGYFVFARASKADGFSANHEQGAKAMLPFDLFVEGLDGDDSWIPDALVGARETLNLSSPPPPADSCDYCAYRKSAVQAAAPPAARTK